jgi:NADPH:quinone reductase
MRAEIIEKFGGIEVLKSAVMPKPAPGEGQLLVRVFACGVNPVDYKIRKGLLPLGFSFPLILGYDVSGVVEAVGPEVQDFQPGDEVFYSPELVTPGAYAEYHVVDEHIASLKPVGLSHVEAASIPLAGCTAWQALFDRACIEGPDAVLIHGGAGGVGSMAVQLASWMGCEVFATASKANREFVEDLGADVVIDYASDDFVNAVLEATDGEGVDAVLDTVGGEVLTRSFEALAPHGCVVSIAPENLQGGSLEALHAAFFKNAELHCLFMERDRGSLDGLARLLERRFIEPLVEDVLPLEGVAKAHQRLETGHGRGKIVIQVTEG